MWNIFPALGRVKLFSWYWDIKKVKLKPRAYKIRVECYCFIMLKLTSLHFLAGKFYIGLHDFVCLSSSIYSFCLFCLHDFTYLQTIYSLRFIQVCLNVFAFICQALYKLTLLKFICIISLTGLDISLRHWVCLPGFIQVYLLVFNLLLTLLAGLYTNLLKCILFALYKLG